MSDDQVQPNPVVSRVRNPMNEWCPLCSDWAGPTWTLTWASGHQEIRCGIHGGENS